MKIFMLLLVIFLAVCMIIIFSLGVIWIIRRQVFKRKYKHESDSNFLPKVAIIYPCKGVGPNLETSLRSILNQKYNGEHQVLFVVENTEDPAYDFISDFIKDYKHASVITAGLTKMCIQKNHNVIKAIESLSDDIEVYAFCDDGHKTPNTWLQSLIRALSIKDVEIATCFRIVTPQQQTLGNRLYSVLISGLHFSHTVLKIVWGGSFVLRKETVEKYNLMELWAKGTSHDAPVTGCGAKILFNPACKVEDENVEMTPARLVNWFRRQWTHFRRYNTLIWALSMTVSILQLLIVLSIFVFLALGLSGAINPLYFLIVLIYSTIILFSIALFLGFNLRRSKNIFMNAFLCVILLLILVYAMVLSASIKQKMVWAGKSYTLDKDGNLQSLEHIDDENDEEKSKTTTFI
jgi:cellulose synthase/poly-beta-1,6-N-acetylglucosamine synthase-like glycosyltransferase